MSCPLRPNFRIKFPENNCIISPKAFQQHHQLFPWVFVPIKRGRDLMKKFKSTVLRSSRGVKHFHLSLQEKSCKNFTAWPHFQPDITWPFCKAWSLHHVNQSNICCELPYCKGNRCQIILSNFLWFCLLIPGIKRNGEMIPSTKTGKMISKVITVCDSTQAKVVCN